MSSRPRETGGPPNWFVILLLGVLVVVFAGVALAVSLGGDEDEPAPVEVQVLDCFLPSQELEAQRFAEFLPLEPSTAPNFDIEVEKLCDGRMFRFHVRYSSDQGLSDTLGFLQVVEREINRLLEEETQTGLHFGEEEEDKPPQFELVRIRDLFTFSRRGDLQMVEETLGWK